MNTTVRAILFSLVVHTLALGVLTVSFSQKPVPVTAEKNHPEAVEVVAVDEALVRAELRRLKNSEQSERDEEEDRQQRLQEEVEQARLAKEAEARHLDELKVQREEQQREAEQQRKQLAELKVAQERVQKEKAELEKKRAEEQQRLEKTEKQRKAEEARIAKMENEKQLREKLVAEERATRKEYEKQLRAKLDAEEKQQSATHKQSLSRLATQYQLDIRNKVQRNWLRPSGTADFSCNVLVRQLPGGEVESAQVTKSCGSSALDRSVEAAVRKASPLPAPPDPELFERELNITFKPTR
jgi:colicin import membrane protein